MNSDQENKVSMYWAVGSVLDENEDVWQNVPAFANAVASFRSGLTSIQSIDQVRSSSTKGATAAKQAKREVMELATLEFAGALAAFASDTDDREMLERVDLSDTDLRRARDTEITTICQSIHDEAAAANLADYGVMASMLVDFQAKIDAYSGTVGKPALAKSTKQAAGVSLDDAIVTVDKVLDEKLDKLAQRFRTSQQTFFETYNAARSIVSNRGGHKAKPDGNGDGGTPANN